MNSRFIATLVPLYFVDQSEHRDCALINCPEVYFALCVIVRRIRQPIGSDLDVEVVS
jgi:hypothetical protein